MVRSPLLQLREKAGFWRLIKYGPVPLLVLLLGLALTTVLTVMLSRAIEERNTELLENSVQRTMNDIDARVNTYIAMLRGGSGYMRAQPDAALEEFRRYVRSLRLNTLYPGIQGIGFSRRMTPDEVPEIVERQRQDFPSFHVWPEEPRDEYHSILYLEPLDLRNAAAIGYDMFTEATRRTAMARARDTGRPAATGRVTLVQEIDTQVQPGFLIYVPLYRGEGVPVSVSQRRARLIGYVYAPFRAEDLFKGIFSEGLPRVAFSIYDGVEATEENLLYRARPQLDRNPLIETTRTLEIAGRPWTIVFSSTPALEAAMNRGLVPVAAAVGVVISLLIAVLFQMQRRSEQERDRILHAERAAREESERLGRMKDEFLATLSHELRTPLTAILGWADLLLSRSLSPEDANAGLDAIARNAEAQSKLIDDLLDMSRIVSGKIRLDMAQTDLREVIKAAVEAVRPMADAREVSLRAELPREAWLVYGDGSRLQQVVWNLLTNAVKFTHAGGAVVVSCAYRDEEVEVCVRDNGQGIAPEFLPHVFDRFRQADSTSTRRHMGLGLGLAIVKSIVDLHGGSVRADSKGLGHGSSFYVTLPRSPVHAESADGVVTSQEATNGHTEVTAVSLEGTLVLLVEDDADSRTIIANILKRQGAVIRAAGDAPEGLQLLRQKRPDLIISDIGMPGMDGYAFIRKIRSLPSEYGGDVPAIALTAFARSQDKQEAIAAGYQQHVAKPVLPGVLLSACAKLLNEKQN